jgi:hypothetical protein
MQLASLKNSSKFKRSFLSKLGQPKLLFGHLIAPKLFQERRPVHESSHTCENALPSTVGVLGLWGLLQLPPGLHRRQILAQGRSPLRCACPPIRRRAGLAAVVLIQVLPLSVSAQPFSEATGKILS